MMTEHQADWAAAAKCRGTGDVLFAQGAAQRRVRVLCEGCPVKRECLAEALDDRIEWGVWGGMTERERRHLLRTRPEVTSWRAVLLHEPAPGR
jgi:WhiB family transcriptional regulator, redox-sensing transcriptional regulator